MSLRFGYGTNGLHSHRLDDALELLADLGYDGVALTLDHLHLDPFAADLPGRVAQVRHRLDVLGLGVVVETGARYLLDPRRKHHPTLLHPGPEAARRVDYLRRAVQVAADLGAEAVSLWSGSLPPGVDEATAWSRLVDGVGQVLRYAEERDVVCAVEPEPGMLVDTLDGVLALRRRLGDPERLRVTLDLGHIVCNETRDVVSTIRHAGELIANVQVDDMVPGVHEHLELGTGEVDFPAALAALEEVGYTGLTSVELPRQSHAAPAVAERSLGVLRDAARQATRRRAVVPS
jgi:sugar phosphate isomerase/epimerase